MRTILIRTAELLLSCITLSLIPNLLYRYWFIDMQWFRILTLVAMGIFVIVNVFMLRRCYFELRSEWRYYLFNYLAYGIFMLITALVYVVFVVMAVKPDVYSWLFNALKLTRFSELKFGSIDATLISHAIMLCTIALAPIGMDWIWSIPDEAFEDDEFDDDDEDETDAETAEE